MSLHRSFKTALLGCIFSAGILAGGFHLALAQDVNVASVSAKALRDVCLKDSENDAGRIVSGCDEVIRLGVLDERDLAAAYIRRAQAHVTLGKRDKAIIDYDDALTLLDKLIDPDVSQPGDLFQRAVALQGLGHAERAMLDYNTIISRDPNAVQAFVKRGFVLAYQGKYGQAIADFESALRLEPKNDTALMGRGHAYGKTGEYARSLADLNQAIAIAPNNSEAYLMRGVSYGNQGKSQRALADYNKALELNPRNADALTSRAAIYEMSGQTQKAIDDLTTAMGLTENDNDALAHYNRGVAYFSLNQFDKAFDDYTASIQLDGKMDMAFSNRCLAGTLLGRDAVKDCDRAVELNPNAVNVYNTRGFVRLKLGHIDKALDDYNAALKLDPNSPHALYGRGFAKIKRGDGDGHSDIEAAKAARPNIARSFSVFGVI